MNPKSSLSVVALLIVLILAGCLPVPRSAVEPTQPASPPAEPGRAGTPEPVPTVPTPAPTPAPADVEIDCMGACHATDINAVLDAGAARQPASHKDYSTCLSCHSTLAKPALPASHLGRLDAACTTCHKTP